MTQAKQLGKDVVGLTKVGNGLMLAKSIRDKDLIGFLSNGVGATPFLGQIWSGLQVLGDVFGFAGIFARDSVLVPMVTNDNRGPQPFDVNGRYNPMYDEGAPF